MKNNSNNRLAAPVTTPATPTNGKSVRLADKDPEYPQQALAGLALRATPGAGAAGPRLMERAGGSPTLQR
jgi:hypothetical protein